MLRSVGIGKEAASFYERRISVLVETASFYERWRSVLVWLRVFMSGWARIWLRWKKRTWGHETVYLAILTAKCQQTDQRFGKARFSGWT